MNNIKTEIRLLIAEKLLGWAMIVAPKDTEDGKRIVEKVNKLLNYCDQLEQSVNEFKVHSQKLMKALLNMTFSDNTKLNVIKFPETDTYIEDYDIAARAESITPETQKQIAERIKKLRSRT